MTTSHLLFVHALSPLHSGTGQSVGAVDLAIARERGTDLPLVPGSAMKGALRARSVDRALANGAAQLDAHNRIKLDPLTKAAFGPDSRNAADHRGGALFGDANLLLLPVRSVSGTFAWVTSPYLLQRFARDLEDIGQTGVPQSALAFGGANPQASLSQCLTTSNSALTVDGRVYFEDLDLVPSKTQAAADDWANLIGELLFEGDPRWEELLSQRFCIVHDDVMSFLARHGTAVVARVALKHDSKTVDNLWHEESLPAETILCSLVHVDPPRKAGQTAATLGAHIAGLTDTSIQLGGKATVGRGRCRLVMKGA